MIQTSHCQGESREAAEIAVEDGNGNGNGNVRHEQERAAENITPVLTFRISINAIGICSWFISLVNGAAAVYAWYDNSHSDLGVGFCGYFCTY
jgi:hypothetical protein